MNYYPLNLKIQNKSVVVVGGGSVALQKILGLLGAGAIIEIISPLLHKDLLCLVSEGRIQWQQRKYKKGDLKSAFLAFAATNNREVNQKILEEAQQRKILLNAVDQPELCDFIIPARVSRGEFLLTVSTGGEAPFLSKRLRKQLEKSFGLEYGLLSRKIKKIRQCFIRQGREQEIKPFLEKYWEKMLERFKRLNN
ncbi:MAG: bifunctional precorrin-2 dehydrogenase/sirohydrochlorin ferrochelatase [Deltaproteobacteria bacterium]|nr:bifunctional precorrin-2 dehydrogenase/sirohydrochlorin ferrochelatase [Deltaproteobacteria bacterium]